MANRPKPGVYVAWKQVTYRSVFLMLLGGALLLGAGLHLAFPKATDSTVAAAEKFSSELFEKVAGMAPPLKTPAAAVA